MNILELDKLIEVARAQQDELLKIKGNDYTIANEDRLWNFKEVAELVGITPLQCWSVYWLKHMLAICTYVKHGQVESEGIESRFTDLHNYNYLGLGLIQEERKAREDQRCKSEQEEVARISPEAPSTLDYKAALQINRQKMSEMPQPWPSRHQDAAKEYTGSRDDGLLQSNRRNV